MSGYVDYSLGGLVSVLAIAVEQHPEEWREGAPPTRREPAKAPKPKTVNTTREQERRMRQMTRAKAKRGGR